MTVYKLIDITNNSIVLKYHLKTVRVAICYITYGKQECALLKARTRNKDIMDRKMSISKMERAPPTTPQTILTLHQTPHRSPPQHSAAIQRTFSSVLGRCSYPWRNDHL